MLDSGIFLIDKPSGLSSAAAIAELRKRLNIKKIGHAGTLDPFATGLLICLTNKATRLASYAQSGRKKYSGTILLGQRTSTDDITGEVISSSDEIPDSDAIYTAASSFTGNIQQIPPDISAVKVDGKRAYKLARKGVNLELKPRNVTVYSFNIGAIEDRSAHFTIECSTGTYIRSIARDLGEKLGCGACLETLRRELSHPFSVKDAKVPSELNLGDLLAWEILFSTEERVVLEPYKAELLLKGNQSVLHSVSSELEEKFKLKRTEIPNSVLYGDENRAFGVLKFENRKWRIAVNMANGG